ncbi:MAG: hypothetical protein U9R12_01630 [Candidatus Caldatribacteriota bacterium]|nr:hypothetical protein [Candidatus Caldatribacteriota bacterium]
MLGKSAGTKLKIINDAVMKSGLGDRAARGAFNVTDRIAGKKGLTKAMGQQAAYLRARGNKELADKMIRTSKNTKKGGIGIFTEQGNKLISGLSAKDRSKVFKANAHVTKKHKL